MIVLLLVKMALGTVKVLLAPIHIPMLDEGLFAQVDILTGYIAGNAVNLVSFVLPPGFVQTLFNILVILVSAKYVYLLALWVIRKIPGGMD